MSLPAPVFSHHLLAASCALLALGLTLSAWRRPNRRRLGLRLLAGWLAAGALWLLAYPPPRHVPAQANAVILLTPGYQPDSLRTLRQQLGPRVPVWSYRLPNAPTGSRPLGSLLALAEQRPAVRIVHLLGEGLPAADLPPLGALAVRWHPGSFQGITYANWPRRLVLGQTLVLEGAAAGDGTAPLWASLRGPGTDSVRVAVEDGRFRLRYRPRMAGRLLLQLVLRQAGRLLAAEPVPLDVAEPAQPPVLLLAAAPSFEFKFLKNSLAATGRAVALRVPISRGLVQTDVANHPAPNLNYLTPNVLARYPLVVAEAAALGSLPTADAQHLSAAVRAGRLGLVVLADAGSLPAAVPGRAAFGVQALGAASAVPQSLAWPDAPAELKATLPLRLHPAPGLRSLVTAAAGPVVAARRAGLGTVVVSVVPETFRWALQGTAAGYAAYWNHLLTNALPPPAPVAAWQLLTDWPRLGYPLTLQLAATHLPAPTEALRVRALAGGPAARLALRQDPRLPEWSTAPYWPATPGWHEVQGPGATTQHFFVFESAAWRGPERLARLGAMRARPAPVLLLPPVSTREPWPAGWFFALFVLAAGFLWLEEKL